jgi:hypothetical protein
MTREELHAQVWSQPMSTLAKSAGISDVALAKRCRAANVPVPPRGWWARKEAGKPVTVEPLPPLPFALANYFPAIDHEATIRATPPSDAEPCQGEIPGPPVFRDLVTVNQEIRAAVRVIKVPAALTNPHPIVARLLRQDTERKPSPSASIYFADRHGPKFARPIQQRRLRILSCILAELDRLGCKASGSTHAGERFSISAGRWWTYILFGTEGGASESYFHNGGRGAKRPAAEQLRFDLVEHDERAPPKRIWREDKTPLEQQATEIVCGLLLQAEEDTRKWALMQHKWACEERERKVRAAKLAAEEAEAQRVAREKAAAAARIESLTSGAEALERAARIRRYVSAVRAANADRSEPVSNEVVDRWARWALAEADTIDPVVSERFLSDLDP